MAEDGIMFLSTTTPDGDPCRIYSSYKQLPEYKSEAEKNDRKVSNYLDQSEGHSHIYTKDELLEIFEQCGMEIVEYKVVYQHHRVILRRKIQ